MTYVIVTKKQTVIGQPFASYNDALAQASRLFGDDVMDWVELNLRVEESR